MLMQPKSFVEPVTFHCRGFGKRGNSRFQRIYRVLFAFAFNSRENRFDFCFYRGLGGHIALPADFALTIAFFC